MMDVWQGMAPWGWVMMTVSWLVVIALVVWTVRTVTGTGRPDQGQALRLLEERYARGEIDQEEYEQRRRVLEGRG